jgi:tryptophan synthase beta subunit
VGPEHAFLHDSGRVRYERAGDAETLDAFQRLARLEGILPALESAHAVAWVVRAAASLRGRTVLLNLSGRGDKDLGIVVERGDAAPHPPEPPPAARRSESGAPPRRGGGL